MPCVSTCRCIACQAKRAGVPMSQAAAAELGIGTPAATSSAIGRLSAAGLYGKPHESLPNQERCVAFSFGGWQMCLFTVAGCCQQGSTARVPVHPPILDGEQTSNACFSPAPLDAHTCFTNAEQRMEYIQQRLLPSNVVLEYVLTIIVGWTAAVLLCDGTVHVDASNRRQAYVSTQGSRSAGGWEAADAPW